MCPQLPEDIRYTIAGYLVCEIATSTIADLWLHRQSSDCVIDTSQCIWACYIAIEGVRYLTKLSNKKDNRLDVQIFDARRRANTIYVLQDHIGIKQLIFAGKDGNMGIPIFEDVIPGCWWRTIAGPSVLRFASDVGCFPSA